MKHDSPSGLSFLVFACPKSGTTWMQRLISAHHEVHCAETRLFGRYFDTSYGQSPHLPLEEYVQILSKHYHPPCDPEDRDPYFQSLLFKLVETIADHANEVSGKRIYGEKLTPYLTTAKHALDQMQRYDPDLRVIHLVRDCRDVIVSGTAHWLQVRDQDGVEADIEVPLSYLLDSWVEIGEAFDAARDRFTHVLEVRYEDMLEDPVREAHRIFSFLGAGCSDGVVERCVEATAFVKLSGGRQRGEEDASSFFRSGTAGQWKDRLTNEQVERVHQQAGALLEAYGYPVPADKPIG